jgi:hypothetical protein
MSHSTFLPSTFNGLPELAAPARATPAHLDEAAPRWPWIAIAGCVLMFATLLWTQHSQGRMAQASQALESTWLPAVDRLTDLQTSFKELSGDLRPSSTWTPGQRRGRITDELGRLSAWTASHRADLDASTPALLDAVQQRWAEHVGMPDVDTPARAARLRDADNALARLISHCVAQSRAQADIAAGR